MSADVFRDSDLPVFGIRRGFWVACPERLAEDEALVANCGCEVLKREVLKGVWRPSYLLEEVRFYEENTNDYVGSFYIDSCRR